MKNEVKNSSARRGARESNVVADPIETTRAYLGERRS
jgi:hypothetical protein